MGEAVDRADGVVSDLLEFASPTELELEETEIEPLIRQSLRFVRHEINAAKAVKVTELNVQNQQMIKWPSNLVVAKAYVDQLSRSQALPADKITALEKAIQSAETSHMSKNTVAKLKNMAPMGMIAKKIMVVPCIVNS